MAFKIIEVTNAATENQFLDVARKIYQNDTIWVCPLDEDIRKVFNPKKNPAFKVGVASRWILKDSDNNLVGRVAAFVHREKAHKYEQPTGGIGFFECIDNNEAAKILFDTSKEWLIKQGMEAMDGPINFGENDRYTGLLVQGFTHPGFSMNYNLPYYERLFTDYGFTTYFDQISRHLDVSKPLPDRFEKVAQWIFKKPGVRFEMVNPKKLLKYIMDFREIYNDAWQHHVHFTPIIEEQAKVIANELKLVIMPFFTCFAYVDNEPAAFVFAIPDLNQIFKPLKGKFPIWQKLLFLLRSRNDFEYYRKRGILTRGRVTVIGTKPKFQRYGLEVGVTVFPKEKCYQAGITEIELGWVGDFNPLSRSLQDATGSELGKVHRVFRYLFDRSKPAQRMESLVSQKVHKESESK